MSAENSTKANSAHIVADYETVTPEMATAYLRSSKGNRKISGMIVDAMARDMSAGDWHETHQGIAFDDEGHMIDGHHRCNAIIMSGVNIRTSVFRGLDATSYQYLDRVRPRRLADLTGLCRRESDAYSVAAQVFYNRVKVSPRDVLAMRGILNESYGILFLEHGAVAKYFASAPFTFGALAMLYEAMRQPGPDASKSDLDSEIAYIYETYWALILGRFKRMSPIAESIYRRVASGRLNAKDRPDVFARALIVFRSKNSHMSRLSITVERRAASVSELRELLKR